MSSESTTTTGLADVRNVSKWFGPVMALNGVNLEIGSGITGLVGPNGAGKTTLLRLLTGQIKASLSGIDVCGRDAEPAAPGTQIHQAVLRYTFDVSPSDEAKDGAQPVVPRIASRSHGPRPGGVVASIREDASPLP